MSVTENPFSEQKSGYGRPLTYLGDHREGLGVSYSNRSEDPVVPLGLV